MTEIDLNVPPQPAPLSRRAQLAAILTAPAPTALVLLLAVLAAVTARMPDPRPEPAAPTMHSVYAGTSVFPVRAAAQWRDAAGMWHNLPVDQERPMRIPAREVLVVVATDGAQCSLVVDGVTVDSATASAGQVAVCSWVG